MSLMATQSKSQFLTDVHAQLKRRYKPKPDRSAGRLSVLEAVVYGICHEDATREEANQALSRFKDQFFDWNEVRVSPIAEVQETLADIPDPQGRAERIRRFLASSSRRPTVSHSSHSPRNRSKKPSRYFTHTKHSHLTTSQRR